VTLVRDGPAAAWDKIKEQLSNLKDMVIGGITDFVVDMVVKKAIPKLIAMFIPGAGFVSAILSIYDTVMVFVNKISQIIQVVTGFIDSLVAIAAGNIAAAANRVEKALANVLSLAISFLAGFAGLGKVADKVMGVINKICAPIDKALDWLVNWIVTLAKKLGKMVAQAGVPQDPKERAKLGIQAAAAAVNRFARKKVARPVLEPLLAAIKLRYGFQSLDLRENRGKWSVTGVVNPTVGVDTDAEVAGITPLSALTAAERATISAIPGGAAQLKKLDDIIAGGGQQAKIDAETAAVRTVLAAIAQSKNVKYIGKEIYKSGEAEALSEIDILTDEEMIEVKTGDYSKETKLSGRDMNQFTTLKRFFEGKIAAVDVKGATAPIIQPPKKWVYQFTNPISKELYAWLKSKGVTEVRTAK
jgi:uncharacterized membrane protein